MRSCQYATIGKSARELLKLASERLSLEQLLAIQLPLGAVLDLTAQSLDR